MPEKKRKQRKYEADTLAPLSKESQAKSDRDQEHLDEESSKRQRGKQGVPRDVLLRLIDWLDQ